MKEYFVKDTNTYELGEVKQNESFKIVFNIKDKGSVVKVKPFCGCTGATHSKGYLTVVYNTGVIPEHMQFLGKQYFNKKIEVIFDRGLKETYSITGKKIL